MSREHPAWYGNVVRSYVAWLIAVAMALAAAWSFWRYSQTLGEDAFGAFLWSLFLFLAVGVVAGVVLNRVVSLPHVSGLVTLGFLGLAFVTVVVDVRLAWALFALAPGIGAAVAAIPGASGDTCEQICLGIYGCLLIWLVFSLVLQ